MQKFLDYKDVWFTFLSGWLTLAILSILGCIFDMVKEFRLGVVLSVFSLPFLIKAYPYYRKQVIETGRQFFFSKVGYIILGISLGLVLIATIFNLAYESGWFNFTDLGFLFLSYPLALLVNFPIENEAILSRLTLYFIVFINLSLVISVSDALGFLCIKLYRSFRSFSVKQS